MDDVLDMSDMDLAMMLDPASLDETKHYRFIQERTTNVLKRRSQGYEVVLRSVHGVQLLNEAEVGGGESVDDLIRIGDSILMMCDKTRFKARRNKVAVLARTRLGAQEKKFESEARRRGVDVVKGDKTRGEPK